MSNIIPIGRNQSINEGVHGDILELGNASPSMVGTWLLHFVPDEGFEGAIDTVGRAFGKYTSDEEVSFVAIPYRQIYLNGDIPEDPYGFSNTPITTTSIVQVPSNGLSVGVLVSCTAGTGTLYSWPLEGPSAP